MLANCDLAKPPRAKDATMLGSGSGSGSRGVVSASTAEAFAQALVVKFPGSLHYHNNFSLSAPLFRHAYAERQVRHRAMAGREVRGACGRGV